VAYAQTVNAFSLARLGTGVEIDIIKRSNKGKTRERTKTKWRKGALVSDQLWLAIPALRDEFFGLVVGYLGWDNISSYPVTLSNQKIVKKTNIK
jgi:hypothetical protein